jgi:hypothetical protein
MAKVNILFLQSSFHKIEKIEIKVSIENGIAIK